MQLLPLFYTNREQKSHPKPFAKSNFTCQRLLSQHHKLLLCSLWTYLPIHLIITIFNNPKDTFSTLKQNVNAGTISPISDTYYMCTPLSLSWLRLLVFKFKSLVMALAFSVLKRADVERRKSVFSFSAWAALSFPRHARTLWLRVLVFFFSARWLPSELCFSSICVTCGGRYYTWEDYTEILQQITVEHVMKDHSNLRNSSFRSPPPCT